jgi:hypothetical protein
MKAEQFNIREDGDELVNKLVSGGRAVVLIRGRINRAELGGRKTH